LGPSSHCDIFQLNLCLTQFFQKSNRQNPFTFFPYYLQTAAVVALVVVAVEVAPPAVVAGGAALVTEVAVAAP
jgi:hypothetical protein